MPGNPFKPAAAKRVPPKRSAAPSRPKISAVANPSGLSAAAKTPPNRVANAPALKVTSKARSSVRPPAVPKVAQPK